MSDSFAGADGRVIVDVSAERERVMKRLRASARVIQPDEPHPSGLVDSDVVGWTKFLDAWFKDFALNSLTPETIHALSIFILTWTLHGKKEMTVEVRVGERDDDVQQQVLEEIPSFTYNPEGKKKIEDMFMTYAMWKAAVGDFKLNTQGASALDFSAKAERLAWGGPIDVTNDVKMPGVESTLDLFLGEE